VTDPYVVSYLQLCQISYLPASAIRRAVKALPRVALETRWECLWGPAQPADQSNLAYVAAYYERPDVPELVVVVIRGTDVAVDAWGVIVEMWEDLDVLEQVAFPWMPASSGALVAQGTMKGLGVIQQLTDGGQGLLPFLAELLGEPQNREARLVVTGHSLGGCLTTVVAPWLQATLSQRGVDNEVVPVTFAGPTAGNRAFAEHYSSSFSSSLRYVNSLDVVPLAWEQLEAIKTIYKPDGLPAPELVDIAIDAYRDLMEISAVSYAQPANERELTGRFVPSPPSWYDEAYKQHHTTTYMSLLGGTSVAAEWPRPRLRSRA
jgi:triacylglycerol lipase